MMKKQRYLHIPKPVFIAHRQTFKKLFNIRKFAIASLYWEHETPIKEIAKTYDVSRTRIYQILAHIVEKMKKEGYTL